MEDPSPSGSGYRSAAAEKASHAALGVTLIGATIFAGWMASTSSKGAFGAIVLFAIGFVVGMIPGLMVFTLIDSLLKTRKQRSLERDARDAKKAAVKAREAAASARGVPLTKWRGLGHMTRSQQVMAYCSGCQHKWSLDGKAANTIAEAQGLGNRMVRGGTKTEQLGATFTIGASGRRIAAGLESERQQRELAGILGLARCPSCGRLDGVHLRR